MSVRFKCGTDDLLVQDEIVAFVPRTAENIQHISQELFVIFGRMESGRTLHWVDNRRTICQVRAIPMAAHGPTGDLEILDPHGRRYDLETARSCVHLGEQGRVA